MTADPWPYSPTSAAPRFATPRDPSRRTLGPEVCAVAEGFGWDFLPWQRYVADVASELKSDGRWAYQTIVLTVPRQVGKTALVFSVMAQRAMQLQGHRSWYTAQSGNEARRTFRDEWVPTVEARMGRAWTIRRSNGEEGFSWWETGGQVKIFPPVRTALHGAQADLAALDEAWAYDLEQGESLLQGIIPTQTTRKRRQVWIISTAGTPESVWARRWVEKGRTKAKGVAIFDWGMPEGADPDDEAVWQASHPALGQLATLEDLRDFRDQMGPEGFARAYLNVWPPLPEPTQVIGKVITEPDWSACGDPKAQLLGEPVYAADSDALTHSGVIAACGPSSVAGTQVELVRAGHGTVWLPGALEALVARHGGLVAVDDGGPVGWIAEELERRSVPIVRVKPSEYARACGQFAEAARVRMISHLNDPRLNLAVAVADRSPLGGGWRWDRKRSNGDVSPLIAATLAFAVAVTHAKPEADGPMIF